MSHLNTTQCGKAATGLYGSWEESFRMLYNYKAEIELRSPGSIVEIDTTTHEGEVHFSKLFIAFKVPNHGRPVHLYSIPISLFLSLCTALPSNVAGSSWHGKMRLENHHREASVPASTTPTRIRSTSAGTTIASPPARLAELEWLFNYVRGGEDNFPTEDLLMRASCWHRVGRLTL